MNQIKILDREFEIFIKEDEISKRIDVLTEQINSDYLGKSILFIAILNGSFMFASDLFKRISNVNCRIEFIKASSYVGTQSIGNINQLIGLKTNIENENVIIIEDIIDTGLTIDFIINSLKEKHPANINVCSLLLKPKALQVKINPKYIGFEVENKFLVGYGLDYDGYGRNLRHIYAEI
ncbi:MAG: hypoxanthine phosphoribosyltransferase [Bacteroidetes bacterium]|nr:hypoxanthine phosphoribosyltransferase [Bacteroidota bacterium]